MDEAQIFISYRRDDSAGYARALHEELARQWGAERVFIDVDDIHAGESFARVIEEAVAQAPVMLVLIGPRWQGPRAGQAPRLHDVHDLVRLEVARGLACGMAVIPVLLDGAAMPTVQSLPEPLWPLAERNALVLNATSYGADLQRLLATLRAVMGPTTVVPRPMTRADEAPGAGGAGAAKRLLGAFGWWPAVAGLAVVGALGGYAVWSQLVALPRPPGATPTAAAQSEVSAAVAATATAAVPEAAAAKPRVSINGIWSAAVVYDWPGANFEERFEFSGAGQALTGTATFLRVPRTVQEGRVDGDRLQFVTRTVENLGNTTREVVHRYNAQWLAGSLRFVKQTEGASGVHRPVTFVAAPVSAAVAAAAPAPLAEPASAPTPARAAARAANGPR